MHIILVQIFRVQLALLGKEIILFPWVM